MEKDIIGYEGFYTVNDRGEVFSLPRFGTGAERRKLKWAYRPNGYWFVTLSVKNKPKRISVHRLVAEHFLEKPKNNGLQVDHIDGDKSNNSANNLRWVTASENQQYSIMNGTSPVGEKSYKAKLTNKQVLDIKQKILNNGSVTGIAKEYKVSKHTISFIKRGRSWKHINLPS